MTIYNEAAKADLLLRTREGRHGAGDTLVVLSHNRTFDARSATDQNGSPTLTNAIQTHVYSNRSALKRGNFVEGAV